MKKYKLDKDSNVILQNHTKEHTTGNDQPIPLIPDTTEITVEDEPLEIITSSPSVSPSTPPEYSTPPRTSTSFDPGPFEKATGLMAKLPSI